MMLCWSPNRETSTRSTTAAAMGASDEGGEFDCLRHRQVADEGDQIKKSREEDGVADYRENQAERA